ncbi:MAG: T9SS type A sorting domain-containing protein, partial [Bacteroidota bacterium]
NEVSYNILDPDGNIIFSDGPFPLTGQGVFTTIACPTCAGPVSFAATDINATSATFAWTPAQEPGSYTLEFGSIGFVLGTGTSVSTDETEVTIVGLTENTYYDVYLSFVCDDDGESAKTLGPITIQTIFLNDVGISGILEPTADSCNLSSNTLIQVVLENFGQNPQSLIPFYYAVNGVVAAIPVPTDGFYTGVIGNDSTEVVFFETTFDFSTPGYYLVEAWTELGTDNNTVNDTFSVEIITAFPLPLAEDFEDNVVPDGWVHNQFNPIYTPGAHNNPTHVIGANVWTFNPVFEFTTQRVGPMGDQDTLSFDYRFVEYFAGTDTTFLADDRIDIQISTDCGDTYETIFTIDSTNHVPDTAFANVQILLEPFNLEGAGINVRFVTTWSAGNYWSDFDNINITGCPPSFALDATIVNATGLTNNDGSITLTPTFGQGPFTYDWEEFPFVSGPQLSGVEPGIYTVIVEDANGCAEEVSYTVLLQEPSSTIEVNGFDAVRLSPNPSPGLVQLSVEMRDAEDLTIDIFDAVGKLVLSREVQAASLINESIDLEAQASGLFFVRLRTETRLHMERLILSK